MKESLETVQKKLLQDSNNFDQSRRELTTLLEEVNASGGDYAPYKVKVNVAYDNCMELKMTFNKTKRKYNKLQNLKSELIDGNNQGRANVRDNCELDRWTVR